MNKQKKQNNNGLAFVAVAVLAVLFLLPRKKKPVIVVHDLDEGEFLSKQKSNLILEGGEIDFLEPYKVQNKLIGCITC